MSDETPGKNWEETLRAMAEEVMGSVERLGEIDLDEMARRAGVDPDRAREWLDGAGQWLRIQVEHVEVPATEPGAWDAAGPHPLDLPTADQGAALAALDSGRWSLEPGTSALVAHGEGPGPRDALGLVRELRVRDWVSIEGTLTITGRHALGRWLDASS
ncbi:MAG TPA: hypothetical protein VIL49_08190 [Capillimicrobium sp.]|jgi:hypothetical protein